MSKKTFSNEENIKKLLIEELIKNPQISKLISDLERAIVTLAAPIAKKILTNLVETINLEKIDTKTNSEKEEISQENRDFSELKDLTLRKYYNNKKRNGQPIEKDLNEELARRFPGYDKETQTFGNNNWSTVSDKSLRNAYRYRTIKNQPIEDELNEELAHRFPGYDKETKTFGNYIPGTKKKKTDWTQTKDIGLRQAYNHRIKNTIPIEPELDDELARRFPGYDKETKTFGHYKPKTKRNTKNLANTTDSNLRKNYLHRKKNNLPIEDALNEELAKRFSGYDKETKTFRTNAQKLSNISDGALRHLYFYRNHKQLPIEDELNEELARRFSGYDKETKTFGNAVQNKPVRKNAPRNVLTIKKFILPIYSATTGNNNKYSLFFDFGKKKSNLLKASQTNYELCLFDEMLQMAIVRKNSGQSSSLLYIVDIKKGKILNNFKQGVKIARYQAKEHKIFVAAEKTYSYTSVSRDSISYKHMNVPMSAETIKANSLQKNTILINKDGLETTCPLIKIADMQGLEKQNNLIETFLNGKKDEINNNNKNIVPIIKTNSDKTDANNDKILEKTPIKQETKTPVSVKEKPVKEPKIKEIIVKIKQIKLTPDGFYNDVFINDKKVLSNHINTKIETFADDTILAIHGIVTNDSNYPVTPMWVVYDTELKSRAPQIKQSLSKYYAQIKNVNEINGSIRLELTNKSNYLLNIERMKKIANGKKFVIQKEKQNEK